MKKIYAKPEAELVTFYSEEEIANTEAENGGISGDMDVVNYFDLGYDWT